MTGGGVGGAVEVNWRRVDGRWTGVGLWVGCVSNMLRILEHPCSNPQANTSPSGPLSLPRLLCSPSPLPPQGVV